nr:MAG TPA: Preprotein translocase subunit secY, Preprotein Transport, Membrane Protein Complex.9A [Caudoviricetes sp.]
MKNIFKLSWAIFKFVGLIAFLIAIVHLLLNGGI